MRNQNKARQGLAVFALATAGIVLLAGCGGGADANAGPAAPIDEASLQLFKDMTPAENSKEVDTTKFKTGKTDLKIGFADVGLVNSWHVQAMGEAEQTAKKLGVELVVAQSDGDATKQISDVEDLMARGVDALVLAPNSPESMVPIVERANESGIPVILWGSDVETDQVTSKVVADDKFFGESGAKELVEDMGGKGNIVMLRGIAGNSVETARYDGAKAVFDEAGIKVLAEQFGDWAQDKGKSHTENFLTAYPNIDGIWSSGGAMTLGAIQAYEEAAVPLVPMSGEGLNGFLKAAIKADLKTSAPAFPTWQGAEGVKLAVKALRGQPIESFYLLRVPALADIKTAVVQDASDDYWVEDYMTREEIDEVFPPTK
ncbi:hypothetical protein CQ018_05065 [Arthrobacter sp. MYb227]|uniref:ABC transporter substrate-binding protein n=1 Tax=Arthrobacter sp. MYb227 TaxID=1848601 RepID=UPI000CFCCF4C|nr:ABC transporter substrate-binding protein [Arthrobacter sp. MYb227]PQZ94720.1 hypothetical protein CQ018_05065 [Arthrobacter sp. MYb227]